MNNLLKLVSIKTLLLAAPVFFASTSYGDIHIATVDVNQILNDSREGKEQRAKIDTLTSAAKKKLEAKRLSLKALEEKLRSAGVAEDSAEAKDFRSQARDFGRMAKDSEDEIRGEFLKVNRTLTEKVVKMIGEYAESNNIDLVLDKGGQDRGAVLYGRAEADITDRIILMLK